MWPAIDRSRRHLGMGEGCGGPVAQLADLQQETVLLRSAGNDVRRLSELAAELIALDVGVLVAVGPWLGAVTTTRGILATVWPANLPHEGPGQRPICSTASRGSTIHDAIFAMSLLPIKPEGHRSEGQGQQGRCDERQGDLMEIRSVTHQRTDGRGHQ